MISLNYEVSLELMKESQIRSRRRSHFSLEHHQAYTRFEKLQGFRLHYCTNDQVQGYSLDAAFCPEPLGWGIG